MTFGNEAPEPTRRRIEELIGQVQKSRQITETVEMRLFAFNERFFGFAHEVKANPIELKEMSNLDICGSVSAQLRHILDVSESILSEIDRMTAELPSEEVKEAQGASRA